MTRFMCVTGFACLALAGCGETQEADQNTAAPSTEVVATESAEGSASTTAFPRGARIVEEEGVTFRIDPDGTRIRLGPGDSRIVIEDDVRFRVDPDGTRVRIDPRGAIVDVDDGDVSLEVGPNPAVTVNTKR